MKFGSKFRSRPNSKATSEQVQVEVSGMEPRYFHWNIRSEKALECKTCSHQFSLTIFDLCKPDGKNGLFITKKE